MFFLDASFLYPRCFKPFFTTTCWFISDAVSRCFNGSIFKEQLYTRNMVSLAKFTRFHNPKSYPKSWEPSINPCPRATSTEPQSTQPPTAELPAGRAPTHHERGKKGSCEFSIIGGTPKSSIYRWIFHYKPSISGYPVVGSQPPCEFSRDFFKDHTSPVFPSWGGPTPAGPAGVMLGLKKPHCGSVDFACHGSPTILLQVFAIR